MSKSNRIWIYSFVVMGILIMTASSCEKMDTTEYESVTIGTQVWMVKNLNVTKYRNGDPIPYVDSNTQWTSLTTGAYCNYDNNIANADIYGRLYNWYAINDSRNIAPSGWHVPTSDEWQTLINYIGLNYASDKLRETGNIHWYGDNSGATDEYGFTALPSGMRYFDGSYSGIGLYGAWWTTTTINQNAGNWSLGIFSDYLQTGYSEYKNGFAVRCIKDQP